MRGTSPIDDIGDDRLKAVLDAGMRVTTLADADLGSADVIFVCVPTPITAAQDPDLTPDLTAATFICKHLQPGQLVVLQVSGLVAGRHFDLAFAPARVNLVDPDSSSKGVPRLVGATTPEATESRGPGARAHQTTSSGCPHLMPPSVPSC